MAIKALSFETNITLEQALWKLGLGKAGQEIRIKYMETIVDEAYDMAKAMAPHLTGELKEAIYKEVKDTGYLVRGKVAIPASIPYGLSVVYGDKRHSPNRFLERALVWAFNNARKVFPEIARKALESARGK